MFSRAQVESNVGKKWVKIRNDKSNFCLLDSLHNFQVYLVYTTIFSQAEYGNLYNIHMPKLSVLVFIINLLRNTNSNLLLPDIFYF